MWRIYKRDDGTVGKVRFVKTYFSPTDETLIDIITKTGNKQKCTEISNQDFDRIFGNVIKEFSYETSCIRYLDEHKNDLEYVEIKEI